MRRIFWVAGVFVFIAALAFAGYRSSASYRSNPDAVTEGGGQAASVSYAAPQQAVGPESGFSANASYQNQVGVIQPVPGPRNGMVGWQVF